MGACCSTGAAASGSPPSAKQPLPTASLQRLRMLLEVDTKDLEKQGSTKSSTGRRLLSHLLSTKDTTNGPEEKMVCLLTSSSMPGGKQDAFASKPVITKRCDEIEAPRDKCEIGYVCQKGLKQDTSTPNQDSFVIVQAGDLSVYGVFDGHGSHGHYVSSHVATNLLKNMAKAETLKEMPLEAIGKAFPQTQAQCQSSRTFDAKLSGTTATVVAVQGTCSPGSTLHIAHVGDSRAVLARFSSSTTGTDMVTTLISEDLTADHRPLEPSEKQRIEAAGGIVRQAKDDESGRVFVKNQLVPGLAMSRSLGDCVGQSVGVSCEPDLKQLKVQQDWAFVLLCSDGIWEFISSQEAVDFIGKYPTYEVQEATEALAAEARRRWLEKEKTSVDDITAICIWFQSPGASAKQ